MKSACSPPETILTILKLCFSLENALALGPVSSNPRTPEPSFIKSSNRKLLILSYACVYNVGHVKKWGLIKRSYAYEHD